jgi:hypothetical protein
MNMKARDVMTAPVRTLKPKMSVKQAAAGFQHGGGSARGDDEGNLSEWPPKVIYFGGRKRYGTQPPFLAYHQRRTLGREYISAWLAK